jgi:hypothetical protein
MTIDLLLLEFAAMITNLMWSKSTPIIAALMLDQFDPHVLPQICVPYFVTIVLFL